MKRTKGVFITFEGGDGAGKSLLIDRLEQELQKRGLAVLKTRNPGGCLLGTKIRELILHHTEDPATPRCELLLYLADRAQHVQNVLLPALNAGKIVLCDRFNDSTIAYQAAGRGLDLAEIKKLCTFATQGLHPDLTLYLDIDPVIGLGRVHTIGNGHDRLESEKIEFHNAVRAAYLALAKQEPERIHVIDASPSPDDVYNQALTIIDAHLTPHLSKN